MKTFWCGATPPPARVQGGTPEANAGGRRHNASEGAAAEANTVSGI